MKKSILFDPEIGEIDLIKPKSKTIRKRRIAKIKKAIEIEKKKRPKK